MHYRLLALFFFLLITPLQALPLTPYWTRGIRPLLAVPHHARSQSTSSERVLKAIEHVGRITSGCEPANEANCQEYNQQREMLLSEEDYSGLLPIHNLDHSSNSLPNVAQSPK